MTVSEIKEEIRQLRTKQRKMQVDNTRLSEEVNGLKLRIHLLETYSQSIHASL